MVPEVAHGTERVNMCMMVEVFSRNVNLGSFLFFIKVTRSPVFQYSFGCTYCVERSVM